MHSLARYRLTLCHLAPLTLILILVSCGSPRYEGKPLSVWITQLQSPNDSVQKAAVTAITRIGLPAREALPALLSYPTSGTLDLLAISDRADAIAAIVQPTDTLAMRALEFALNEGQRGSQFMVTLVLRKFGIGAMPLYLRLLQSSTEQARVSAASGLGALKAEAREAIPSLQALLADSSARVRTAAQDAIQEIQK